MNKSANEFSLQALAYNEGKQTRVALSSKASFLPVFSNYTDAWFVYEIKQDDNLLLLSRTPPPPFDLVQLCGGNKFQKSKH